MTGVPRRVPLLAIGGLAVAALLQPVPAGHGGEVPAGYISESLDNGLRVSILPDPQNPVVATQLWYHVGSAHERPASRGFAHLFEHLMFGKTLNHDRDDYSEHHHRYGGYENAYTMFDETVYHSQIAPERHEKVLEMEADRMANLVLDENNLENEKRIVAEELRLRMENDPFSRVMIAALRAVLRDHPYAHTPGGTIGDVSAASLDDCREFYADYYRPGNAHLVIVGPVDGPGTLSTVRRLFGGLAAGGAIPPEVPVLDTWSYPGEVTLREDLPPVEIAMLAYPLPAADSDDRWPLAILRQLLGGGAVDPFEELLVKRHRKAVHAETQWLTMRRGGALIFAAAHLPYRRKRTAFRLSDSALDALGDLSWLTEDSLTAAKNALIRIEMGRRYHADRRADAIGRARWWLGDERQAFEAAERIESVSLDEVARVFRERVIEGRPVRLYLEPERVPWYVRLFGWMHPLVNR